MSVTKNARWLSSIQMSMLGFLRKIRRKVLSQGKAGKYVKYAIGEIVLVVLGILIALQINGWQQEKQDLKLEKRYVKDLIIDLQKDSVNIHNLYLEASLVAAAKDSLYKIMDDPDYELDSLKVYFKRQWEPYKVFSPSTSTIDEMKSSSHLDIIRDDELRKKIVSTYHEYELFRQDENLFNKATREIQHSAKAGLRNISDPGLDEIKLLMQDHMISNTIRTNFAFGRLRSIRRVADKCNRLIRRFKKYQE